MEIDGYHNTDASNVDNIFKHGFTYRYSDTHWLGQGIYFFADAETAFLNLNMLDHTEEQKTIEVKIEVPESEFLDMDNTENLNSFIQYCENQLQLLKQQGKAYTVKENDKKKAMLKFKCFFLDAFKAEKGYGVIIKTFPKEKPPYAATIHINGIDRLGLAFLEKYICVSDNKYIVKKNLIEQEWMV